MKRIMSQKWRLLFFTVVALSCLLTTVAVNAAVGWGTAQTIDNYVDGQKNYHEYPQVAVSGNLVVAAWQQYIEEDGLWQVWGNLSTNGGVTWGTSFQIDDNTGDCGNPYVAVSGSNIVIVYTQEYRVYSYRSLDSGSTWQRVGPIDDNTGTCVVKHIAIASNHTVAVWMKSVASEVYSNHSLDFGTTWDGSVQQDTGTEIDSPRIAMDGLNTILSWSKGGNIYYTFSPTGGTNLSWSSPTSLGGSNQGLWPQPAISGDNIVVVWAQGTYPVLDAYFNHSSDAGANWDGAGLLENLAAAIYEPQIAISGSNALAAWEMYDGSFYNLHYNRSTDGGATWLTDSLQLNDIGTTVSGSLRMGISGNNTVCVWTTEVEFAPGEWGNEVHARCSTDGGANWGLEQNIDVNNLDVQDYAEMAISGSTAVAVWSKQIEGIANEYRIYSNQEFLDADFGDAPNQYPVTLANNGAYHVFDQLVLLGSSKDYEPDGQPSAAADGDDLNGIHDDEDGIVFSSTLAAGQSASLSVTSNVPPTTGAFLNAWIDFNIDGDWDDSGEQVFTNQALTGVEQSLTFTVPADAQVGTTYARFRANLEGSLGPSGPASNGEVEDYQVTITSASTPVVRGVGGEVEPVNKLIVIVPWLALLVALFSAGYILRLSRRKRS